MGACFSSPENNSLPQKKPTVLVISVNGDLRQYAVPVTVFQVLNMEISSFSCFVCNSDRLYYDDYIQALDSEEELQAGQIYFVLPSSKLQYKLSASDMAALAVKASVALQSSSSKNVSSRWRKNKNKTRISPVVLGDQQGLGMNERLDFPSSSSTGLNVPKKNLSDRPREGLGVSRSGSVRKLHRYSSKRAKMAVRSFRLRLTTIYEGSVLQFF